MPGMRHALAHTLVALFAFAGGIFADNAAYRAVDYVWPDADIADLSELKMEKTGYDTYTIVMYYADARAGGKAIKAGCFGRIEAVSDRSPRHRRVRK